MTSEPPDVDPDHPDYGTFPLRSWMGFDLDTPEPGVAVGTLDVTADHLNPNGVVHGGVVFALVDTTMGSATMSVLDEGNICASIEAGIRYLRPITGGRITARTEVLRRGRRVVHLTSTVTVDDTDEPSVVATGSFAVIPLA